MRLARLWRLSARIANFASLGVSSTINISTTLLSSIDRSSRQRQIEGGPFVLFTFRPYSPAVAADDARNNRKSYPFALEVAGVVQTLKDLEKFVTVAHIEAGPVVLYKKTSSSESLAGFS